MDGLKVIIAENMICLRKAAGMSQAELGEKLGYTDKAVSKWERGESVPDIYTLRSLADLYGISIDYLTVRHENNSAAPRRESDKKTLMILAVAGIFLLATAAFAVLNILGIHRLTWLCFIYALPVSSLVLLILGCIFGKNKRKIVRIFVSLLLWTVLLSLYLSFLKHGLWLLFTVGVPAQIVIILSTLFRKEK